MSDLFLQLEGKRVLLFGVANRKSVAFHIGQLLTEVGALVVYVVRSEQRKEALAKIVLDGEIHVCDVEFEDQSNSINHVLHVSFVTQQPKTSGTCSNATTTTCTADVNCPGGICRIGVCSNDAARACSQNSTCTAPGTCDRNAAVNFSGIASQEFNAEPSEFYYAEVRLRAAPGFSPTVRVQFGYNGYTCFNIPCGSTNPPAAQPPVL